MPDSVLRRSGKRSRAYPRAEALCVETQSREIMASLVNDVVADALRLGLHDEPEDRVVKANDAADAPPK